MSSPRHHSRSPISSQPPDHSSSSPSQQTTMPPPSPQSTHQSPYHEDGPEDDPDYPYPYPEPSASNPLLPPQPANFSPFFTIIEDSLTGELHHPYVHYVFADDDPSIVTAAAMRALGVDDTEYLPSTTHYDEEGREVEIPAESPLPPREEGVEERYIVVDLEEDGRTVGNVKSLAGSWQVTGAGVRRAPGFGEETGGEEWMLKVEGVGVPGRRNKKGKEKAGGKEMREGEERLTHVVQGRGGDVGDVENLIRGMGELLAGVEAGVETAMGFSGGKDRGGSTLKGLDMAEQEKDKGKGVEERREGGG